MAALSYVVIQRALIDVVCNEFEHINAMKTDPLAKI